MNFQIFQIQNAHKNIVVKTKLVFVLIIPLILQFGKNLTSDIFGD